MRVGLVGCVKGKRVYPAPAKDLYVSPLFGYRRAFVERSCDRWFILSALYGLVDPEQELAPYDLTLKDASISERRRWSNQVLEALDQRLGNQLGEVIFEIHAGNEYRSFGLVEGLVHRGGQVEVPTDGLSLGQQLAFYKRALKA